MLPLIRQIAGNDIALVDTGDAIARELKRQLHIHSLLSENHQHGSVQFWSTDDIAAVQPALARLWDGKVSLNPRIRH